MGTLSGKQNEKRQATPFGSLDFHPLGLAGCVSVPLPNQNPTSTTPLPINLGVEPEESPKPLVTEALITESLLSKEMPLETHGDLPGTTPAFAGLVSLQATDVVSEALKRNQSLVAISKALEAAQSKYSQAISLEDPSIGGWFAPGTIGSNQVDFAMRLELSQRFPHGASANFGARWQMRKQKRRKTILAVYDCNWWKTHPMPFTTFIWYRGQWR